MGELSHLLNVRSAGVNHQGWKLPAAFVIGVETPLSPMPKPTRDGHTHGGAPCVVCQFLAFAGASLVSASSIGSYPIIVSLFVTMNLNQAKTLPLQRHLSVAAPRAPPIAA